MAEIIIVDRKRVIDEHVAGLKEKVAPVGNIVKVFTIKGVRNNSMLKIGASLAIDFLVGQKLLSRFTRLIIPTLLRTVSSKVIGKKDQTPST